MGKTQGNVIATGSISATQLAENSVIASRITAGAVTQAKIAPNSLDSTVAGNVADINTEGGIVVLHRINAVALTGNVDVVLTHKTRVVDAWAIQTAAGGAGDTIQFLNGATAITNALDLNVAEQTVVRATTIENNLGAHEIAAGGTLRVTGASAVTAICYVLGIRVA